MVIHMKIPREKHDKQIFADFLILISLYDKIRELLYDIIENESVRSKNVCLSKMVDKLSKFYGSQRYNFFLRQKMF